MEGGRLISRTAGARVAPAARLTGGKPRKAAAPRPTTHPTHLDGALLGVAPLHLGRNRAELAVEDGHRLGGVGHRPRVERAVKLVQLAAVDVEGDLAARARLC